MNKKNTTDDLGCNIYKRRLSDRQNGKVYKDIRNAANSN